MMTLNGVLIPDHSSRPEEKALHRRAALTEDIAKRTNTWDSTRWGGRKVIISYTYGRVVILSLDENNKIVTDIQG